jgi:hypothetical protein
MHSLKTGEVIIITITVVFTMELKMSDYLSLFYYLLVSSDKSVMTQDSHQLIKFKTRYIIICTMQINKA